jgi:hypothetical protein
MQKSQPRNNKYETARQGNMTLPKVYNSSMTESKDTEMAEMSQKEFKRLLKMNNHLKEESNS